MTRRKIVISLLFVGYLCVGFCYASTQITDISTIDTILITEEEKWLFAAMTPVVALVGEKHTSPFLYSLSSPIERGALRLLLKMSIRNCLVLTTQKRKLILPRISKEIWRLDSNPLLGSAAIAKRFWQQSDQLLIAPINDPQICIQAAILAANMKIPIIIVRTEDGSLAIDEQAALSQVVQKLQAKKILLASPKHYKWPIEFSTLYEKLKLSELEERIISKLERKNIRNVIVTYSSNKIMVHSAWITPYLSFMRGAPVVFADSSIAKKVEKRVYSSVSKWQIYPKTLTIIAHYHTIGIDSVIIPANSNYQEEYYVEVEPCSIPPEGQAASLGVGRIPFDSLGKASLLIVKGLFRERLIPSQYNALMVANPEPIEGALPLAETISRATAEEFKNLGVNVNEFYRLPSDDSEILNVVDDAHVVIFEGHVSDQKIFTRYRDYGEEIYRPSRNLHNLPLVVLQSCSSLEEVVAEDIFHSGGIALIGSVTSIHSGSGSGFIKTFCDSLLYQDNTLGEALRDARNYYLCLNKLKQLRNHQKLAQGKRVALSFRLWGDPEVKLFGILSKPKRRPVKAKFVSKKKIKITVPKRKLPKSKTDRYFTRMFPRSKVAGIVKSLKYKDERRVMLLYYFRLPLYKGFKPDKYINLTHSEDDSARSVFLTDSFKQYVYILRFPKGVNKDEKIYLKFSK